VGQVAPAAEVLEQAVAVPVGILARAEDRRVLVAPAPGAQALAVRAPVAWEAPILLALRPTAHLDDSVSRWVNKARDQHAHRAKRGQGRPAPPARGNA
jgi:hypothetical protein